MTYNVNYQLWDTVATEKLVRAYPADIFGLVEPYKEQAADLWDTVQDLYPHYYRATGGNLSLLSRYPIIEARADNLKSRHHSLFATLDIQGKAVQVIVIQSSGTSNQSPLQPPQSGAADSGRLPETAETACDPHG
jgi:hypothetical protein